MPGLVFKPISLIRRKHVLFHGQLAGAELLKIISALSQREAVVRARANVERIDILTIILPKANRANLVITTRGQGDVITARALLLRRRGTGLMPP